MDSSEVIHYVWAGGYCSERYGLENSSTLEFIVRPIQICIAEFE